jgi:hypothetical protein
MKMTKRRSILLVAAATMLLAAPVRAQTLAVDDPVLQSIWDQAMENSHIESMAQALLDSIGPRLVGSPGMHQAQDWAVNMLSGFGFEAGTEEYGTWESWSRGISHIDLISPRVRSLEGRILAFSPGTGGEGVEAGVVMLPSMSSPADFEAFLPEARDKFVMIDFPQPTCRTNSQWQEYAMPGSYERMNEARQAASRAWGASRAATGLDRRALPAALEAAGVAGLVTTNWAGSFGTNRVFNSYTRDVPTFELGCEDYGLVARLAENGQGPVLRLTAEAENMGERPVSNVIARMEGTEKPDEYVILSAHFDSWEGGSGATDNGTGSVLMMEAARILAEVYPNPKRTILIGLWNSEEQGLNGSHAFVEDNPDVLEGLQALFNQDNGTGRIVNMSASGLVDAAGPLGSWLAMVPAEVTRHINFSAPGMPSGGGTDHASFICAGAPGFSLGALNWGYFDHTWHTQRDTFDKLVFDDLMNNAVLIASLAYLASEDPEMVSRERRAMPMNNQTGQPRPWPTCNLATRSSGNSSRMQ